MKNRTAADFGKHERSWNAQRAQYESGSRRRLTVADGVERVIASLRRMGVSGNAIIVSTNIQPRLDGMPRSNQGEPTDPGVAVYWTHYSSKQRRCMAVDRYTRVADNLAAIAATLEAMRAIERHGGAEILERAFLGFQSLPPPINGGRPWTEVLFHPGYDMDITLARAEEAYRNLAHEHHPDKGGDPAMMAELNEAIRQAREVLK
jgi:hypothetical protein